MVHPPDDIAAVRNALTQSDARLRSGAIEYLDNLLDRRHATPRHDAARRDAGRRAGQAGNVIFKTRVRDVEDTLAQLVHDDDQVIAAAADPGRRTPRDVVAGRRPRARAGAPRSARLGGVRSGVLGAGRASADARTAARALARAAPGSRARRSPAAHPVVQLRVGQRALPDRRPRPAGATRSRSRALRDRAARPNRCSSCSTDG